MSSNPNIPHKSTTKVRHAVGLAPGLYQPVELPKITKEMKQKIRNPRPVISKIDKDSLGFHGERDWVWQRLFGLPKKEIPSERKVSGFEPTLTRPMTTTESSKILQGDKQRHHRKSKIPVRRPTRTKQHELTQKEYKQKLQIPGALDTRRSVAVARSARLEIPPFKYTPEQDIRGGGNDNAAVSRTPSLTGSIVSVENSTQCYLKKGKKAIHEDVYLKLKKYNFWPVLPYTRTKLREPQKTALKVEIDDIILDRFNFTEGEPELNTELRLVIFGNTGCGKSLAANIIAGKNNFHDFARAESSARKSVRYENVRFGYRLILIEIPGFFDPLMEEKKILKELTRCVGITSPGPHAFVFVLDGFLFTKHEQMTLKKFAKIFGEDIYKCLIVLFTHKDIMEYSGLDLETNITRSSSILKRLLCQCENRYLIFNNFANYDEAISQAKALVKLAVETKENNDRKSYTNDMYQEAERVIRHQMKEKEVLIKHEYAIRFKAIEDKYEIIMAEEKLKQDKIMKNLYEQLKAIKANEEQQEKDLEWIMELQEMQIMYNDIRDMEKAVKIGDQIIKLIEENKEQLKKNKELQQKKDYSDLLFEESDEKLKKLIFHRELLVNRNEQEFIQERANFRENIRLQCQIEEAGFFKRLYKSVERCITVTDIDFSADD